MLRAIKVDYRIRKLKEYSSIKVCQTYHGSQTTFYQHYVEKEKSYNNKKKIKRSVFLLSASTNDTDIIRFTCRLRSSPRYTLQK